MNLAAAARTALICALTVLAVYVAGALSDVGSTRKPTVQTAKRVARSAQVGQVVILAGRARTVTAEAINADESGYYDVATDDVDLRCPEGSVAIGGGMRSSQLFYLVGSSPGASSRSWRIEVSYEGAADSGTWTPYVTCA